MSEVRADRAARPTRRGVAAVLLALLGPQATLLLLRTEPRLDLVLRSATAHLVVVSAWSCSPSAAWPWGS